MSGEGHNTGAERPSRRRRLGSGLRRLPLASRIGLAFIAFVVLVAIFGPSLLPHDPAKTGLAPPTTGPSGDFWFGVDRYGRDVFGRLVAGSKRSLLVGFGATGLALVAGSILGAVAATRRKATDELIMRMLDVVMAFPTIILAALLVVAFGKGNVIVIIVAIAFVFTPPLARVVRANVAAHYGEDYVAAERIIGATRWHILVRHVARNCAAPVLVFTTVMVANAIVFEASLAFIGGGLQPQDAESSWGSVIALGQTQLLSHGWWSTFFPGMLILTTVLALNMLSEGISDLWAAPAARGTAVPVASDRLEALAPVGTVTALPGLEQAAARLAESARPTATGEPILAVTDLRIGFPGRHAGVDIVDGVSFDVRPGEVLGIVGESGCGKSLTALAVMGLLPAGARVGGQIRFGERELVGLPPRARRPLMGTEIAMIYQDALSALNPAMTIGAQLRQVTKRGGTRSPEQLLGLVGLDPRRTLKAFPHELSGGQRQRVVIAMALSRDARLIIADEPTTALDVTVQAQIVKLLLELREELGFALIIVSHDLALLSDVCDRVVVMYGGQVVEAGTVAAVLAHPQHHYARGLLGAVLSLETGAERLVQIRGTVPSPAEFPPGCRFADRCPMATEVCTTTAPAPQGDPRGHLVACHHPAVPEAEPELVEA